MRDDRAQNAPRLTGIGKFCIRNVARLARRPVSRGHSSPGGLCH